MKLSPFIVVGTVLFAAAALWAQGGAAPAVPTSPGRYQISASGGTPGVSDAVWIVDTQTGDTWRRYSSVWSFQGNPAQDAPAKKTTPQPRSLARVMCSAGAMMNMAPAV